MAEAPLLDAAAIAGRIPHSGSMCLLDALWSWSDDAVHCTASNHRDPHHPMRTALGLLWPCAIEYAAQAMALHGAVLAQARATPGQPAAAPVPGFLVSVRQVEPSVGRLDTVDGPLHLHATRLSGDDRQLLYAFRVLDAEGGLLVQGRAVVVLDATQSGIFSTKAAAA